MSFVSAFRSPFQSPFPQEGGAAWSPLDISPVLWFDFSDIATLYQDAARTTPVTTDGDVIGGIADKSGNGKHAAQSVTAKKALYKTGIQNGLSASLFDFVDDYYSFSTLTLLQSHTLVVCGKRSDGSSVLGYDDANEASFGATSIGYRASGELDYTLLTNAANWYSIVWHRNANTISFYRNAAFLESKTNTSNFSLSLLGRKSISSGVFYGGHIGDVLVFNSALSTGDLASLETYLNTKWAIY